jgi:hypothetical protein
VAVAPCSGEWLWQRAGLLVKAALRQLANLYLVDHIDGNNDINDIEEEGKQSLQAQVNDICITVFHFSLPS